MTSITIGKNLTNIDDYGFYGCNDIKKIYYYGTADKWSKISIGEYNGRLAWLTPIYLTPSPYTVARAEILENQCVFDFEIEASLTSEATLIVGIYDNKNKLIGYRISDVDLSSGKFVQNSFAVDFEGTPYKYKIMLWKDLYTIKPVMEHYCNKF